MEEACDGPKAHGGGWPVSWIAAGTYKDVQVGVGIRPKLTLNKSLQLIVYKRLWIE